MRLVIAVGVDRYCFLNLFARVHNKPESVYIKNRTLGITRQDINEEIPKAALRRGFLF